MRRVARVALGAVCFGVAFSAATARAERGMHSHALAAVLQAPRTIVLRGTLTDDPRRGRFDTTVLMRAEAFTVPGAPQPWRRLHRTLLLRATTHAAAEITPLTAGDHIDIEGEPRELRGFDARYRWAHAVARIDVDQVLGFRSTRSPYLGVANRLRNVLLQGMQTLPFADRSLLGGFLLGDTRGVDQHTVDEFRSAGLSHLLAVSGANVAFVLALVEPLQRRLRTGGRYMSGVAVVVVFAAMTRFEPSVLRASAMALVVMTARASGRPVRVMRSLTYAVMLLLLVDPFLLHSVGFQLSTSACVGIALLARPLERLAPGPEWMRSVLAVTIAAQIGVAPVLLMQFGSVAWIAPATNLLAVPAAEPITVLAIPIAAIGAVTPALAAVAFVPVVAMLWWTRKVAHLGAHAPVTVAMAAVLLVAGATVHTRRARRDAAVSSPS